MKLQRLDKIIATQFNISRSMARLQIHRGKVTVDGKCIRDPSEQFEPDSCMVEYKGQALDYKEHIYIMMNKPEGILSASEDKKRETVVDLVPENLRRAGLFPVGRLDRDTTGLLIITDDGDFAHRVISPKKNIFKTYKVTLDGDITDEIISAFEKGVTLADGTPCRPAKLVRVSENVAEVKISEGKYHQIKRMFGTVGLGVVKLERTAIGNLMLDTKILRGECREMSDSELNSIFA